MVTDLGPAKSECGMIWMWKNRHKPSTAQRMHESVLSGVYHSRPNGDLGVPAKIGEVGERSTQVVRGDWSLGGICVNFVGWPRPAPSRPVEAEGRGQRVRDFWRSPLRWMRFSFVGDIAMRRATLGGNEPDATSLAP
ncbi:hypothetical protein K227x_42550 [Rubripirellula lacrimiformis]|uniref:Uncharacterized protein n=1 Tax=Rubripirellula lacrimiformis TaxID=1930273 RepID=A0A517NFD9_9BACT|nr:hypothetical protein K227x_42550 [Rubripirellula lacrimiformis]